MKHVTSNKKTKLGQRIVNFFRSNPKQQQLAGLHFQPTHGTDPVASNPYELRMQKRYKKFLRSKNKKAYVFAEPKLMANNAVNSQPQAAHVEKSLMAAFDEYNKMNQLINELKLKEEQELLKDHKIYKIDW